MSKRDGTSFVEVEAAAEHEQRKEQARAGLEANGLLPPRSNDDAKAAKDRTWRTALQNSGNLRNTARQLMRDAELTTMRRLICAHVVGGEAEYWRQVEEELNR